MFLKKAIFYTSLLCFRVQTREVKVQIWPSQYYNMRLYVLSLGYVSDWNHLPKKEKRWLLLSKALLAYTNGFQQACSFKVLLQVVTGLCAETCSLSCYLEEGDCGASYLVPYCWSFLQVCENYPLSSRAFRNGNLKVRSYYEQKGTLRMRKSEKKVSRYIKRAETFRDLLMKVVNFPALWWHTLPSNSSFNIQTMTIPS